MGPGVFGSLMGLPGVDAPADSPGERLRVFRPAHLAETEWFAATDSARMWRVYHEEYTFCVLPPEGNARDSGATYSYRNMQVRCRPHGVYLYEPDTVHANRIIHRAAAFYVLRVDTNVVVELAHELGLGPRPHFRVPESFSPIVLDAFRMLTASLSSADALEQQTCLADVLRIVMTDASERRPTDATVCGRAAARAREYLHAHALESVTLDELARVAGVSRYHLARSFRKTWGVAPHAYQSALRCAEARRLLRLKALPAAIDVGFFDQSHLTRHFTRAYGLTPAAYQRAVAVG